MNSHAGESFTEQSGAAHATDRVQVRFHPGQSKEEGKGSRVGGAALGVGMDWCAPEDRASQSAELLQSCCESHQSKW